VWQELGIAPTSDAREIRRAYALRLRDAHPEHDPAAFQRLRWAYERALAWAEDVRTDLEPSSNPSHDDAETDEESTDEPAFEQAERFDVADDHEVGASLRRFETARAAGDTEAAFAEFSRGAARGVWSLDDQELVVAELMQVAVEDERLPIARFAEIARATDWDRPVAWDDQEHQALRERVLARLGAGRWYTELKAAAAGSGGKFEVRQQRLIARALLGRLPRWRMRLIARESIRQALEEYERCQPWARRLISTEHADYLVWLRDDFLKAKAAWSPSQKSKRGSGVFPMVFVIAAVQAVLALLRDCNGH
jgi:hypothetical protein